ncbi:hypothetical protein EYF80_022906 [Liparis tanakae]|uniref:Uncharacterized protein n=1 Tax=Liparis tanakae TaxID=230148 RepID=A0A4Z2HM56_9TELE|nr:hypothetical protein EYF80_022906 [Liparis tanakae]
MLLVPAETERDPTLSLQAALSLFLPSRKALKRAQHHRGVQIPVQCPARPPGATPSPALQLVPSGSSWGPICGSEGRSQEFRKGSDGASFDASLMETN